MKEKPEYARRYRFDRAMTDENNLSLFRIGTAISEDVEKTSLEALKEIAKRNNLNELIVLNEKELLELLKKHEKRALYYDGDGYSDGKPVYDMAYCQTCGQEFEEENGDWGDNYCKNCGQRLD